MEQLRKQLEEQCGMDLTNPLEKLYLSEEKLIEYFYRFLDDEELNHLPDLMQEGREKELEDAAHSLKGVAANLGMTGIFEKLQMIVTGLRQGIPVDAPALYEQIMEEKKEILQVLHENHSSS